MFTVYTITAVLEVSADSEGEALSFVRHAISSARKAEINTIDMGVTGEPDEDHPQPENPRERGDDDGVEYADPRDEMADRLDRD